MVLSIWDRKVYEAVQRGKSIEKKREPYMLALIDACYYCESTESKNV